MIILPGQRLQAASYVALARNSEDERMVSARILSANIIRLDKVGHPCARGILDHVAGVEDLFRVNGARSSRSSRHGGRVAARGKISTASANAFAQAASLAASAQQRSAMPRAFNDDHISGTVRACYRSAIPR
jgi:hypothetical protein